MLGARLTTNKKIRYQGRLTIFCLLVAVLLLLLLVVNVNVNVVDARATHITSPTGLGLLGVVHTDGRPRRSSIFIGGGGDNKSTTTTTRSKPPPSSLYRWGNLGHNTLIKETLKQKIIRYIKYSHRNIIEYIELNIIQELKNHLNMKDITKFSLRIFRTWIFYFFSKDCMDSIYEDKWHAERSPEDFFGSGGMWISTGSHKEVVRRRMNRSKRNRQWVGLGYTPRLVWLVGVLLRGTFSCTAIDKVFNPSITSWGAGTVLGAKCTHQEWISSFMLGWYGSYYYWKLLFGCNGPPGVKDGKFEGIPISISKIRIFGKVKE
jgi:hypothetical protein